MCIRDRVSIVFLIQRGLAAGVALYAPAVVLSVILGWPDRLTTLIMGALMVFYTAVGGIKAVKMCIRDRQTVAHNKQEPRAHYGPIQQSHANARPKR